MSKPSILNVLMRFLAYSDSGVTENPTKRAFDWDRKIYSVPVQNAQSDERILAPGESYTLYDGTRATLVDSTTAFAVALIPNVDSGYRFTATGPASFRTARPLTLTDCSVSINNNALATFDFGAASLSGVIVGDVLRIAGLLFGDASPYLFNPLNAGEWKIIGTQGSKIYAVRPDGQAFQGVAETVTGVQSAVQVYSAAGVQVGDKVAITGGFSPVTQKTFVIKAVQPSSFDVVSTLPLPLESNVAVALGDVTIYTSSKRFVYIEVDQAAIVQYDGDTSVKSRINPISACDKELVGFANKWGDTYKCVVINNSINSLSLKFLTAE